MESHATLCRQWPAVIYFVSFGRYIIGHGDYGYSILGVCRVCNANSRQVFAFTPSFDLALSHTTFRIECQGRGLRLRLFSGGIFDVSFQWIRAVPKALICTSSC